MVQGWNPIDDFKDEDFSNLYTENLEEMIKREGLRFNIGRLRSIVRGSIFGATIGYGLSVLAEYPAEKGAMQGSLLFGFADMYQYELRYNWHVLKEFFQK